MARKVEKGIKMKTEYKRTIGKWTVTVNKNNLSIIGDYTSNFGVVYPFNVGKPSKQWYGLEWGEGTTNGVMKYIDFALHRLYGFATEEDIAKIFE